MCPATDILIPSLNFISREYDEPLIRLLAGFLGHDLPAWQQMAVGQLIFFLGTIYVLWLRGANRNTCLLGAVSLVCTVAAFRGLEPYLFKWQWFPFLCGVFLRTRLRCNWFSLCLALPVIILWSISAGSMSCCGLLLAFMLSRTLEQRAEQVVQESALKRERYTAALIGASLLFAFLIMPVYPVPQYPSAVRLVPISPLDFYPEPFLGPYFEQSHLLYTEYRLLLKTYSARLLVLSALLALLLLPSFRARRYWVPYAWGIFVLGLTGLLCCGELLFPVDAAFHAPYPTIALLVPGLALGLPWHLVPGGLAAAMIILLKSAPERRIALLAAVSAVLCVVSWVHPFSLAAPEVFLARRALSNTVEASVEARLHSPSNYIARLYGSWVVADGIAEQRDLEKLTRLVKGEDVSVTATASPAGEQASLAVDGDSNTRWSTGGPQHAGDWFELRFSSPVPLLRVALSVKESPADFPRGIQVQAGTSPENLQEVLRLPDWPGALHWTPEDYPYFGGQSEVLIDLPVQQEVQILRFTQLAQEPRFDWSIREVKLYRR